MNNSVICYYPGSGGNRLKNKMQGKEYQTSNVIYDNNDFKDPNKKKFKYLINESKFEKDSTKIILTHCMDLTLVRSIFPNREIIQIVSDYKKSLRRQWEMVTRNYKKEYFENDLDNAYSFIKWHAQYYKEYPLSGLADKTINIDVDVDEFSLTMRTELELKSNMFDLAWDAYCQYGDDAPIIDLYNSQLTIHKS